MAKTEETSPIPGFDEGCLEIVGSLVVPRRGRFTVKAHFNPSPVNPVRFGRLSGNFLAFYLPLIEGQSEERMVFVHKSKMNTTHEEVMRDLGIRKVIGVSQIHAVLAMQPEGQEPNGQTTFLKVDGSSNFFRAFDKDRNERIVSATWSENGWNMCAPLDKDVVKYEDLIFAPKT